MSTEMDNLTASVTKMKGTAESATAALNGLGAYIEAHKNDPVALQALADGLNSDEPALAAAIVANPIPA